MKNIILVDKTDRQTGIGEKLEVHKKGLLHRAFSILIFDSNGRFLLQKRAKGKYHSGGLWTNACCSHPKPGEDLIDSAKKRLMEEMGISCDLDEKFSITYRAEFENCLIEYEFDHILLGICDQDPVINPQEADGFRWIEMKKLKKEIQANPEKFTLWLKVIIRNCDKLCQKHHIHE